MIADDFATREEPPSLRKISSGRRVRCSRSRLLGVEQESLHRRMQERVEQAGPGAADVVAVGCDSSQENTSGHRAQQVPGVEPQQEPRMPPFFGRAVLAADRHDEPAGAARRPGH